MDSSIVLNGRWTAAFWKKWVLIVSTHFSAVFVCVGRNMDRSNTLAEKLGYPWLIFTLAHSSVIPIIDLFVKTLQTHAYLVLMQN